MRTTALALVACILGVACSSSSTSNPAAGTDASADGATAGDSSTMDDGGSGDAAPDAPTNPCSGALATILGPIDQVTTGAVTMVSQMGGARTVYVDATAGGFGNEGTHPRVYVNLETATRVDITDKQAPTSNAWDLAFKRPVIFTNDGDGGHGMGGSLMVAKAFDQVTMADAVGTFATESFTEATCDPKVDGFGDMLTTMSSWYDYNQGTNKLTPKPTTTFIVRGATGKLYKVGFLDYYGNATGGTGSASANYLIQIAGL